jgi:ribosomal protein L3 glutamine methyltransferase
LSFTPKRSYATQFGNVKEKENNELLPTRSLEELPTILNELKTVCKTPRDLIRALVTLFVQYRVAFGQGTRSAYEDAYTLVFGILSLPLTEQDDTADALFLDGQLAPSEINKVMQAVTNRIAKRVPTAYLIRQAVFGQFSFYVDPRVIIPRSFIAELLTVDEYHQQIMTLMKEHEVKSVLDLCTGSGCLAVMAASAFPNAEIYAADISDDALKVARINIEAYGLGDRVKLVKSDLFSGLAGKRFDLIISNPPYVSADRMRNLPLEFRHEPTLALDGGPDGLSLIRRLVISSRDHMTQNGLLVVETSGHKPVDVAKQFALLQLHWLETSAGTAEVMAIRSVVGQSYEVPKKGKDVKSETAPSNNTSTQPKKSEEEPRVDTSDTKPSETKTTENKISESKVRDSKPNDGKASERSESKEPAKHVGVGRVVLLNHKGASTEANDTDVNNRQHASVDVSDKKSGANVSPNDAASSKTYSIPNGLHFQKKGMKPAKSNKFNSSNFQQKHKHKK